MPENRQVFRLKSTLQICMSTDFRKNMCDYPGAASRRRRHQSGYRGIYEIRDLQNIYFRHANFDPVEYFAYRGKKYPHPNGETYEPMSLTYQPMSLQEENLTKLGDIKYKTKWYPNGATTQAMYLTVMHRPEDNGLDFNFEHQIKAVSREDLEYLYYYLCKIMFKGTENPNLKIGDIIKLI